MTSPLPPRLRDTRSVVDRVRQDRNNLKQLGVGIVGGRFSPAKLLGVTTQVDDLDDDDSDASDAPLFKNTDTIVAGPGDVPFLLTEKPEDGSVVVHWHPNGRGGIHLPRTAWYRYDQLLTIPVFDGQAAGDVYTAEYAYYPSDQNGPAITSPAEGESVSDTTPTIIGTGDAGYSMTVRVDGVLVGTTTVDYAGSWTVTVASALAPGNHTITAEETGPNGYDQTATSAFVTPSPNPATAVFRGGAFAGNNNDGVGISALPLPAGTVVGDLIVVSAASNVNAALAVTDARLTAIGVNTWIGFATTLADLQITARGGYGKQWGVACMTIQTNAVGWTSPVQTSDLDISNGETIPIGSVSGVAAAVCTISDGRSVVSGIVNPPLAYTDAHQGSPPAMSHARVDLWTNATLTNSPTTTAQFNTGTHGTAFANVIGLIAL